MWYSRVPQNHHDLHPPFLGGHTCTSCTSYNLVTKQVVPRGLSKKFVIPTLLPTGQTSGIIMMMILLLISYITNDIITINIIMLIIISGLFVVVVPWLPNLRC